MGSQAWWKLEWNEGLSVGIPEVDEEHRQFMAQVNTLNQAIIDRRSRVELMQVVQALLGEARRHFAHEEAMFEQWNYPGRTGHARQHARLAGLLDSIMNGFATSGPAGEWLASGLKFKDALIEHLLSEDMRYRDYYRSMPRPMSDVRAPT